MSLRAKLFKGKEFDLQEDEPVVDKYFHIKGFTIRLLLITRGKRQEETRK